MAKKQNTGSALQELKQAIREKKPGRLYFFYGVETFLLNHYLEKLKKLIVSPLTESFNFHRFNEESWSVADFADAVEMLPMMADRTLIQVDDIDLTELEKADCDSIDKILQDIPEYCTVVFTYISVAWKPDKRLRKTTDSCGLPVEFAKQDQRELIPWVYRHFAAGGKQISQELCAYLIEITDGTMSSLTGEIEKICAFSGSSKICRADIDAVTEPVLNAAVFEMTDMLCNGNYNGAVGKLDQLLKMQQEPFLILGAIGKNFRSLSAAKLFINAGKTVDDLKKETGMWDKQAKKTMGNARNISMQFLAKASSLILMTDYRLKSSYDNPRRLLELLLISLSLEEKHG